MRRHGATVSEGDEIVTRTVETVDAEPEGVLDWTQARALVRVRRVAVKKTRGSTTTGERTFLASYSPGRFTPSEWLTLIVASSPRSGGAPSSSASSTSAS